MKDDDKWMDEYMTLIEDCEHRESRLSAFERGYIDSIKRQLLTSRVLGKKQIEKLEEIWTSATEKG